MKLETNGYQLMMLVLLITVVLFSLVTRFFRVGTISKKTNEERRKMVTELNTPVLFAQILMLLFLVVTVLLGRKILVANPVWFGILVSVFVLVHVVMETTTAFMFADTIEKRYVYIMNLISYGISICLLSMVIVMYINVLRKTSIASYVDHSNEL